MADNEELCVNAQLGMPMLEHGERSISWFEFWPIWIFYIPVAVQWLLLALRYRSWSLPLIANPAIPLSGMVGVPKSAVFDGAGATARAWVLPWCLYQVQALPMQEQINQALALLQEHKLEFPVVAKPNIGCRGVGVKLLHNTDELRNCLSHYPPGANIQFQQLAQWEAEAGIFYVREPDAKAGTITSLTLKYTPYVTGDGRRTLAELVAADERAGKLQHLYKNTAHNVQHWHRVLAPGERHRLLFSATHSRGAVFRDARELISTKLSQTMDTILADIPGLYYGRMDVKFKDIDSLRAGRDFAIIEINGASAESINIWDRNAGLGEALKTLLQQYRTLFKLGAINRDRGHKPPGFRALIRAWQYERRLAKQYPLND
ncbi:MAG: hypothetical protein ACR2PR_05640 [Pseudohongiellaceae bacterium]